MQFQEIDMQGKFHIERLSTMPNWTSGDEGRIIWAEDAEQMYFGGSNTFHVFAHTPKYNDELETNNAAPANLLDGNYSTYVEARPVGELTWYEGDFIPWENNTWNLGTNVLRWNYVYANILSGEATEATYADLAEKYTAPQDYPTGTIVEVSDSETYEMCAAVRFSEKVSGVVSKEPGYLMNAQGEGINVGLVGRVPIRVIGPVKKRDWIIPAGDGLGQAGEKLYKMAIALESNNDPSEKMIECLLKV
jgi:hypothetical protein